MSAQDAQPCDLHLEGDQEVEGWDGVDALSVRQLGIPGSDPHVPSFLSILPNYGVCISTEQPCLPGLRTLQDRNPLFRPFLPPLYSAIPAQASCEVETRRWKPGNT